MLLFGSSGSVGTKPQLCGRSPLRPMSLGNAYYYFKSKEHLIQAFYDRTQVEHAEAAAPVLEREIDLAARIIGVVEAWVDAMEPYRAFAGTFFKNAGRPNKPSQPVQLGVGRCQAKRHRALATSDRGFRREDPEKAARRTSRAALALLHGNGAVLGTRPHRERNSHPPSYQADSTPCCPSHRARPLTGFPFHPQRSCRAHRRSNNGRPRAGLAPT